MYHKLLQLRFNILFTKTTLTLVIYISVNRIRIVDRKIIKSVLFLLATEVTWLLACMFVLRDSEVHWFNRCWNAEFHTWNAEQKDGNIIINLGTWYVFFQILINIITPVRNSKWRGKHGHLNLPDAGSGTCT